MSNVDDTHCLSDDTEAFLSLTSLISSGDLKGVMELFEGEIVSVSKYKKLLKNSNKRNDPPHPVCLAAETGHVDILDFLISAGFDPEESDNYGDWRPIHHACEHEKLKVLKSLVLKHEVDVNATNSHYDTPLFLAVDNGDKESVEFLIEAEADVNYCEAMYFTTALHKAAANQPEICEYLISAGADVNAEEKNGCTPLHVAAYGGCEETARMLLDNGANVNSGSEIETPFITVIESGNLEFLKLLYSRAADVDEDGTALHAAITHNMYDISRYLVIDVGVILDRENYLKETPFSLAVKEGNKAAAQLLIKAGYDPGRDPCLYDDNIRKMRLNEDGEEFIDYMRKVSTNPRSLQDISCFRIRGLLGRDASCVVDELPLPQQLKDIVMLRHV